MKVNMKPSRTCRIIIGRNFIGKRDGRPIFNRYHRSRKRLLALGLCVGRKAKVRATS